MCLFSSVSEVFIYTSWLVLQLWVKNFSMQLYHKMNKTKEVNIFVPAVNEHQDHWEMHIHKGWFLEIFVLIKVCLSTLI